jgi:hypothetical protein
MIDIRKLTGDSKMVPTKTTPVPSMPPPPQRPRPRELHPAAADTIEKIHLVWEENERLSNENIRLSQDNEVLKRTDVEKTSIISDLRRQIEEAQRTGDERLEKSETHFRERLAESERSKERYLRFAVTISERLKAAGDDIAAAHESAMEMAHKSSLDQTVSELDAGIAKMIQQQKE